jgi:hypothetical protein
MQATVFGEIMGFESKTASLGAWQPETMEL